VVKERLLPNILGFELREKQQPVFDTFLEEGNVGVYWPPGQGKMYFLGMVFTRLPGKHVLFVNTDTIREQWCEFFKRWAPACRIQTLHHPKRHCVTITDLQGDVRCTIDIYSYLTRQDFSRSQYVVSGFDEAHFLPGNSAHRLSIIDSEYRVGLTATPFREDGRSHLIQLMTGANLGDDWDELRLDGSLVDVPVRVLIVEDVEHKFQALRTVLNDRKTVVFSDSLEDGRRIAYENDIPFVFSETKDRLTSISNHKRICLSRVGDCGIDIPDLEEVIEFSFQKGSRNQELQRYGRLLHSKNPVLHTLLMTKIELAKYGKRLGGLEERGFKIRMEVFTAAPVPYVRPAPTNMWLHILGVKESS
jgi:DNA excision repair protein ERCC-3